MFNYPENNIYSNIHVRMWETIINRYMGKGKKYILSHSEIHGCNYKNLLNCVIEGQRGKV